MIFSSLISIKYSHSLEIRIILIFFMNTTLGFHLYEGCLHLYCHTVVPMWPAMWPVSLALFSQMVETTCSYRPPWSQQLAPQPSEQTSEAATGPGSHWRRASDTSLHWRITARWGEGYPALALTTGPDNIKTRINIHRYGQF